MTNPKTRRLAKAWIRAEDLKPDGTQKRWWLELPPDGEPRHGPWDTRDAAEAAARKMGVAKFNVQGGMAPPWDPIYTGGVVVGGKFPRRAAPDPASPAPHEEAALETGGEDPQSTSYQEALSLELSRYIGEWVRELMAEQADRPAPSPTSDDADPSGKEEGS